MQRTAMFYPESVTAVGKDYTASGVELYLEDMCKVFGTQLREAEIVSSSEPLLTRRAKPIAIRDEYTGGTHLVQFQLTRFSPLHYKGDWFEVYSDIRKDKYPRRKSLGNRDTAWAEIANEIRKKHGTEPDTFSLVTDWDYVPSLAVSRFEKELYFAVFNLGREPKEEELKPFNVFDANRYKTNPAANLPDVWILYHRSPVYRGASYPPNTYYDSLTIDFPMARRQQRECVIKASEEYPMKKISVDTTPAGENKPSEPPPVITVKDPVVESHQYQIHSRMPTGIVMGFIQQYIKQLCGLV